MNIKNSLPITLLQVITGTKLHNDSEPPYSISAINWLIKTRLGSVLFEMFPTLPLSPELSSQLKTETLTAKFWQQTQYQAVVELISELNAHNLSPTLLKGISVGSKFYPKPYFRAMRDIDLLVEEDQIEQVERVMLKLGYKQKSHLPDSFYITHHHTIPWQHPEKEIWFEIHRGLFPPSSPCYSSNTFSIETISSEKIRSNFNDIKVYRLGYEIQILYIAIHWGESFKQIGGLFALVDTALIINNTEIDWDKLAQLAKEPEVANYVFFLLTYLDKYSLISNNTAKLNFYKLNHSLSTFDIYVLEKLVTNYLVLGKPFGRILTINNVAILWKIFFSTKPSLQKLILAPVYIIFPPKSDKKFNLKFLFSRIKNFLFKSSY